MDGRLLHAVEGEHRAGQLAPQVGGDIGGEHRLQLGVAPLDVLELLTRGLVERVCDGRLDEGQAADLAVGRAAILLNHGVYLPLTPAAADCLYALIHEQEKCVYYGE